MDSANDCVINVQGLGVERGETTILHDVNWQVARGEHWAILGANGSGKTSLLQALTAYLTPSCGVIQVDGETYGQTDWSQLRQRIGLVSSGIAQKVPLDEPALKTVLSGPTAQLGYWTREPQATDNAFAHECLARMRCEHLAERNWMYLSQGERQRVFIARALMTRPVLLILDEPCAGLDPVMREMFLKGVAELAQQPNAPTLILVTHHVEEILPVFSHTLILRGGETLAQGPTENILRSDLLSEAFGAPLTVTQTGDRWELRAGR
ncbi:ABC transporter ATP-binding protein [Cerasicoccus arenae]|uniref:Iron ABC transporter ATP-binding protein n=1 Tax=Cerasicoccus arenae TaxID=424488 RepID=A0A8J3DBG2_9BACT|nr:ABC transporter ATP-binding protein [Cerasicoccus arenae]MBK1859185.1 ABC transporter ATP-binding protein [Cerasicoccus arenae]GHC01134.1 iron ABC transporter ATP-binding protein [Cerasicoccus arenae]